MSTEQDQVRRLAERIARRMANPSPPAEAKREFGGTPDRDDLAALRADLSEINRRLAHIESHIKHEEFDSAVDASRATGSQLSATGRDMSPTTVRSPWLSGVYVPATHPSGEKFGVEEATVSELVDYFQSEKKCELEPGGKPCDHCAMCSSRGF